MEIKKCPYCGKSILSIAKVCKHCGQSLVPQEESAPKQETALEEPTVENNYQQQNNYNAPVEENLQEVENLSGFQYFEKCLQHYADFNGRARRKEYWMFVLFNVIFSFVLGFFDGLIGLYDFGISDLYSLAIIIPSIAVCVRRMHDVDKSGWYCLIPIYNLILACTEGTLGENRYGKSPK
jgi:uncharacterized membrane protein YhaH (DUF805 family)